MRMLSIKRNEEIVQPLNDWIDQILIENESKRVSCESLHEGFCNFYSKDFLSKSYFVEVKEIPIPYFMGDYDPNFRDFLDLDSHGITYKNTYFIKDKFLNNYALHMHELVHVAQWDFLGSIGFISSYLHGLKEQGYLDSPLEIMAYAIQDEFEAGVLKGDVLTRVEQELKASGYDLDGSKL